MKRKGMFFIPLLFLFCVGCKYYQTPEGTYYGDYYSDFLPINSGDGVVTIKEIDSEHIDFQFSSPGNPDILLTDLTFTRQSSTYGTHFHIHYGSAVDYPNLNAHVNFGKTKSIGFGYWDTTAFAPNGFFISF